MWIVIVKSFNAVKYIQHLNILSFRCKPPAAMFKRWVQSHTVSSSWLRWELQVKVDFPYWMKLRDSSVESDQADARHWDLDWEVTDNTSPGFVSDSWHRQWTQP